MNNSKAPNIPGFNLVASGGQNPADNAPLVLDLYEDDVRRSAQQEIIDLADGDESVEHEDVPIVIDDEEQESNSLENPQPTLIQDLRKMINERNLLANIPTRTKDQDDQMKMLEQLQLEEAIKASLTAAKSEEDDLQKALAASLMDTQNDDAELVAAIEASRDLQIKEAKYDEDYLQASKRLMAHRKDTGERSLSETVSASQSADDAGAGAGMDPGAGAAAGGDDSVLVDLVEGDPVIIDIEKDFYKANLSIVAVKKIENEFLWSLFQKEVEIMRDHRKYKEPGYALNMRGLYHGTSAPVEQIVEEGLDNRLSRKGHFGRGIYFSDDPLKCVQYSEGKRSPYMLRCRVLLGDMKEYPDGQADTKLIREPYKNTYNGQKVYYDSVCGKPRDFMEYVVYERRRVLLEHVVYYEEKTGGIKQDTSSQNRQMTNVSNDDINAPQMNRSKYIPTQVFENSTMDSGISNKYSRYSLDNSDNEDNIDTSVRKKQPQVSPRYKTKTSPSATQTRQGSVKSKRRIRRLVDSDSDSEDDTAFSNHNNQRNTDAYEKSDYQEMDVSDGTRHQIFSSDCGFTNKRRQSIEKEDRGRRSSLEMIDGGQRSSIEVMNGGRMSSAERLSRNRRPSIESDSDLSDQDITRVRRSSVERKYKRGQPSYNQGYDSRLRFPPRTNIEIEGNRNTLSDDQDSDAESVGNCDGNDVNENMNQDDISVVMESLVADFLMVTALDPMMHSDDAKHYIKLANYNVQRAIEMYYDDQ